MGLLSTQNLLELTLQNVYRPYNYNVSFSFPSNVGLELVTDYLQGTLTGDFLVNSASLPNVSATTRTIKVMGRDYVMPNKFKNSGTWSCTFYVDELHTLSTRFETWIARMDKWSKKSVVKDGISDVLSIADGGLFGSINIKTGTFAGTTLSQKEYTLKDAFPINISGTKLGDNMLGNVGEFTVEFVYNGVEISGGGFQLPSVSLF